MGDFFYYRGFCKHRNDKICRNINCHGESCFKWHQKKCIFFNTFGDCKFGKYCSYHHDATKTHAIVELKDSIEDLNILEREITKINYENEEKLNKIQSEELATKLIHRKAIKLEEQLQNPKIYVKTKDDIIIELASKK